MEPIRLATVEEIEQLKRTSDLTPTSTVWAMTHPKGGADFAVVRICQELDPVIFSEHTEDRRKAVFFWGMENIMRSHGVPEYYSNVRIDNEAMQNILTRLGATPTSVAPELRFKKVL